MEEARIQAEKLAVEHVTEPRKRVPVASVARRKGPPDAIKGKSPPDLLVFHDVLVIVKVDEVTAKNWTVGRYRDRRKGGTDHDDSDAS